MAKPGSKHFVSRERTKRPNRPKGGVFKHKKSLKGSKSAQRQHQGPKSGARAELPVNSPLLGDDDDFGAIPLSPSTDEDEGSRVALPDEDTFAAEASPTQEAGQVEKQKKKAKKRKAEDNAQQNEEEIVGGSKSKKKRKKQPNATWQEQQEVVARVARLPARQQAQWLRDSWHTATGASELETEVISEDCMASMSQGESLEESIRSIAGRHAGELEGRGLPNGSPAALLICAAAMSCVHMIKKLPRFSKARRIAKLFAKHMKVPEQQQLLDSHAVGIGCGTPNRLLKLADIDALKLDRLRLLVLDVQLDAKQRTTLSMPETAGDFWMLVSKHIAPLLPHGNLKIVLLDQSKWHEGAQQAKVNG